MLSNKYPLNDTLLIYMLIFLKYFLQTYRWKTKWRIKIKILAAFAEKIFTIIHKFHEKLFYL